MTTPIDSNLSSQTPAKRIAIPKNEDGSFANSLMQHLTTRKMTPEETIEVEALRKFITNPPGIPPGRIADNYPDNLWGEITLDGKVAARIYKSGGLEIPNRLAMDFTSSTAAGRAAEFLRKFGGSLELLENEPVEAKRARFVKLPNL